ncbi:MAG: hypothetical protein R3F11_32390 [Verrucomicrobiales bacterium]
MRWLNAGVPDDPAEVTSGKIRRSSQADRLGGEGAKQQMTVRAKYSDGTDRDVTKLAVFMSNNGPGGERGRKRAGHRQPACAAKPSSWRALRHLFTEVAQVIVIPKNLQYERPQIADTNWHRLASP